MRLGNVKLIALLLGGGVILVLVIFLGVSGRGTAPTSQGNPTSDVDTQLGADTSVPDKMSGKAAIEIMQGKVTSDGCTLVELNTDSWGPIHVGYTGGADPFFQLHDNEPGFYFNAEFYTVYGSGWTGQPGTYELDCEANGICVYLVPDDVNSYLANSGTVTIRSLSQAGGNVSGPVDVTFENVSLHPVPGANAQGCYNIESATLTSGG